MKKHVRRNRRVRRALMMAAALVLVAMISVGGTIAWLSATSGEVKNTFTVGDINITLDEADTDNSTADKERDTENSYKVIPGATVDKDPTVHVLAGSEKCYVFVKVTNTMVLNNTVVATPNIAEADWKKVGTADNAAVYVYTGNKANQQKVVTPSAADNVDLVVFTQVEIAATVTKGDIETLNGKEITIVAYAHQAAETDYNTALAAALDYFEAKAN